MINSLKLYIEDVLKSTIFSDFSKVLDRVSGIEIKDNGDVFFVIDITGLDITTANKMKQEIIVLLQQRSDIGKINIALTSNEPSPLIKNRKINNNFSTKKIKINDIKKIILTSSGKGGVGKSTISSLFAQKLASLGYKIGLLDADIYGPSIPTIFGLSDKPDIEDKKMIPLNNFGVYINSIGFLVNSSDALSLRGPMISKVFYQLLSLTKWGALDYLFIDMPPGTGDIHLSLLGQYQVHGVIMITTPQLVSSIDVERSINLYNRFTVPVKAVIENMSYYFDITNNRKVKLFPGNAGQYLANKYAIPILAKVVLDPELANFCDLGKSLDKFFSLVDTSFFVD